MSLVSLVEWNVSLGSADVSWGGVRAITTTAKETTESPPVPLQNRNIKRFGVLPIRIVKFNVSSVGPSSERNMK